MTHARQITSQERLSAMIRLLSGIAAAALVFSLVFFSPLIDMKDTIGAAAQSWDRGDRGDRSSRGDQGDRSSRGDQGDRSDRGRSSGGGSSSSGGASNESKSSNSGGKSSPGQSSAAPSAASGSSATQKSGSGSFLTGIFGERRFSGDSEPSGEALSAREEREAIQNGWQ